MGSNSYLEIRVKMPRNHEVKDGQSTVELNSRKRDLEDGRLDTRIISLFKSIFLILVFLWNLLACYLLRISSRSHFCCKLHKGGMTHRFVMHVRV